MKTMICSACVVIMMSLALFDVSSMEIQHDLAANVNEAGLLLKPVASQDVNAYLNGVNGGYGRLDTWEHVTAMDGGSEALTVKMGDVLKYAQAIDNYWLDHLLNGNADSVEEHIGFTAEEFDLLENATKIFIGADWKESVGLINWTIDILKELRPALANFANNH